MYTLNDSPDTLKVLVVDSHEDSLFLSTVLLEHYDMQVLPAMSSREALEKFPLFQPDLLISELCLPEEDGYTLIRKLTMFEVCKNVTVPAIALTTQATQTDQLRALSAGYRRHIAKPVSVDELIAAVFQVVAENRQNFNFCRYCG